VVAHSPGITHGGVGSEPRTRMFPLECRHSSPSGEVDGPYLGAMTTSDATTLARAVAADLSGADDAAKRPGGRVVPHGGRDRPVER